MPQGEAVASFTDYVDAQRAVDHLSDSAFPVENLSIIGEGLTMVERVMGRLTTGRVALAGLMSGAWFGLFVGLLLAMLAEADPVSSVVAGVAIGGAFGLLFSLISYAASRGRRDFTSQSQIIATRYVVLCSAAKAPEARRLLVEAGIRSTAASTPAGSPYVPGAQVGARTDAPATSGAAPDVGAARDAGRPAAGSVPSRIASRYVTEDGRPRYGVRTEDLAESDPTTTPASPGAPAAGAPGTARPAGAEGAEADGSDQPGS